MIPFLVVCLITLTLLSWKQYSELAAVVREMEKRICLVNPHYKSTPLLSAYKMTRIKKEYDQIEPEENYLGFSRKYAKHFRLALALNTIGVLLFALLIAKLDL